MCVAFLLELKVHQQLQSLSLQKVKREFFHLYDVAVFDLAVSTGNQLVCYAFSIAKSASPH